MACRPRTGIVTRRSSRGRGLIPAGRTVVVPRFGRLADLLRHLDVLGPTPGWALPDFPPPTLPSSSPTGGASCMQRAPSGAPVEVTFPLPQLPYPESPPSVRASFPDPRRASPVLSQCSDPESPPSVWTAFSAHAPCVRMPPPCLPGQSVRSRMTGGPRRDRRRRAHGAPIGYRAFRGADEVGGTLMSDLAPLDILSVERPRRRPATVAARRNGSAVTAWMGAP